MLTIHVPSEEFFEENNQTFFKSKPFDVALEHSLISLSKWESAWGKPYLASAAGEQGYAMRGAETISYFECMLITKNYPPYLPKLLFKNHRRVIVDYISSPQTATTITRRGENKAPSKTIVTSELIYFWMTQYNIPFECEKWHLNRLLTLIDVCGVMLSKHDKSSKLNPKESAAYRIAKNKARRSGL